MPRNLDLTALRSFVAVAEKGGVTRASGFLNLTQSAVSMQLKRLEDALAVPLLDRSARTIALTATGEQLLAYARRMLELNDEVIGRLTADAYEGKVVLGVPYDIVYPLTPRVLRAFALEFPRVKVQLISSNTATLKPMFARGEADFIVTTEDILPEGAQRLATVPLVWMGAQNGTAYRQRPLRLAHTTQCIFRRGAQEALDRAGIAWESAVESIAARAAEALVSADLAVCAGLAGAEPPFAERLGSGSGLPELAAQNINLYCRDTGAGPVFDTMERLLRQHYEAM
ncbi:LysR family transcriptional regulator [Oceaniovalibus guishaninsula]|nr:LysR family transcriptional regulator [Oceaniovalibus guishaninsula]